jgi:hypothetical protein
MRIRNPAVISNPSRSKEIEIGWNLPVRLDGLTDHAVSKGDIKGLALPILDAASALACAKGEWCGQDDISPILREVAESFRIVSSLLFDNPFDTSSEGAINPERSTRAQKCTEYILGYVRRIESSPLTIAA